MFSGATEDALDDPQTIVDEIHRPGDWREPEIQDACGADGFPRSPSFSSTRAREVLMIAGAGGAMRATGWRATAIRFQQFGEGGVTN